MLIKLFLECCQHTEACFWRNLVEIFFLKEKDMMTSNVIIIDKACNTSAEKKVVFGFVLKYFIHFREPSNIIYFYIKHKKHDAFIVLAYFYKKTLFPVWEAYSSCSKTLTPKFFQSWKTTLRYEQINISTVKPRKWLILGLVICKKSSFSSYYFKTVICEVFWPFGPLCKV